jgi:hypothetical protein
MIQDIPATNDSDLQDMNDFSNNVTDAIDTTNSVTDQQKDELHSELVQLCSDNQNGTDAHGVAGGLAGKANRLCDLNTNPIKNYRPRCKLQGTEEK